jgi:hypothetical protein
MNTPTEAIVTTVKRFAKFNVLGELQSITYQTQAKSACRGSEITMELELEINLNPMPGGITGIPCSWGK